MKQALFCLVLIASSSLLAERLPSLPEPMTNNASASVHTGQDTFILSAMGLGPGRTWRDTLSSAYLLKVGDPEWRKLPDVPGPSGRLASIAVAVRGKFFVFGGYTVTEDGTEISAQTVHMLNPLQPKWIEKAPMQIPVDDTVAVVYQDRYVYLVSGWHDLGNVNLVQVYDVESDTWTQATPFPGSPVFGHAGGIVGNVMIICDGVKISIKSEGNREFSMSNECYRGEIDPGDFRKIAWYTVAAHPEKPRYRMASTSAANMVLFAGGSENPYNYDGIGYNGIPSVPENIVLVYSTTEKRWSDTTTGQGISQASMDHRGFVQVSDAMGYCLIGGMREQQQVVSDSFCWIP